jgi:protein CpxP
VQRSLKFGMMTLAVIVAMTCFMAAQTYGGESQPQGQTGQMSGQGGMHAQGAQGVQERLNWLSQQLNLTDDQKTKLKPILQDEQQKMQAVHENTSLSQDQKRAQMKQIHQSYQPQIQAVLTPEQQQKLSQMRAQQEQRHQQNMGGEANEPK